MRKLITIALSLFLIIPGHAQLLVNLQSPPAGYTYKPQLWNMVLTNTGSTTMNLHIEVTLNDINSSQQVLSGITRTITLPPGTTQLNASMVMPVQYNIAATVYNVDANPMGLLPIGEFEACYHFFRHNIDFIDEIAEQCHEIRVEPLSPPQLIYPYDQTGIEETRPQLSWLPPVPVQLFSNLNYDLTLVEMNPNQSASDAIQQNIPLYQATSISSNALIYPLSAPALEYNKSYAWRVVAKSNGSMVGSSETWQFNLQHFSSAGMPLSAVQPFVQLRKDPETAYAIFVSDLKFGYFNETSDTSWKINLIDLNNNQQKELVLDSLALRRGQNLVQYKLGSDNFFQDRHLYQLSLSNSRNEVWRLRFEYRRPTENNN